MTMFIQIKDGKPFGFAVVEDNLRALFPDHKFPALFTPADVSSFGYAMYEFTQMPEVKYPNKIVEITPTLKPDGIYYQTWSIVEMTPDEKTNATVMEANNIRNSRNIKLLYCDWTQIPDAPLTQEKRIEWATYRQALRDVPSQAGFPWDVQWPVEP